MQKLSLLLIFTEMKALAYKFSILSNISDGETFRQLSFFHRGSGLNGKLKNSSKISSQKRAKFPAELFV